MASKFDISPEQEARMSQWLYRQFFLKTPPLTRHDADLKGRTAIITGSNTGLGLEAAQQLLDLGLSELIMAVRDVAKAATARERLLKEQPQGSCDIKIWSLDLSSFQSVMEFVEQAKRLEHLDIVILNAALYKITQEFNPSTGYDEDIHVNYLSNVLLMVTLLPCFNTSKDGHPGRLVLVSSEGASWARFAERTKRPILGAFKEKTENWGMQERYGTSKLLGQFFFTELARRVPSSMVTITTANPGFCYGSELAREGNGTFAGFLVRIAMRLIGKPLFMGARSIVYAAAGFGEEVHGQYIEDGLIRPLAPIIYQTEGEELGRLIWGETMTELAFAGVKDIVGDICV
ncbi:hypothetical protein NUW58_g256 [Xylaria curta]|uniref:Uncharacterized protein n=1 Tax=Xylaria curta TaxID=42375 RepID=A0ACC1PQE7_9PEZI|nr:hypothetical protein NUW58_g256 [Xylaria curta]